MEISIKDLGAVREANIELKPLTIFVGPNNTGKTWAAYIISALFGARACSEYLDAYVNGDLADNYLPIDDALTQLLEHGNSKIDLIKLFDELGEYYFNNLAHFENQWIQDFMGSSSFSFQRLQLIIKFNDTRDKIIKNILLAFFKGNFFVSKEGESQLNILKEKNDQFLYIYTSGSVSDSSSPNIEDIKDRFPMRAIKTAIYSSVFSILSRSVYNDTIFFPSERTALSSLEKIFRPIDESQRTPKKHTKNNIEYAMDVTIPDPIGHAIRLINSARLSGSHANRLKRSEKSEEIANYLHLAEVVQEDILQGRVDYSDPEPNPLRELIFTPSNMANASFDMPITSSMVKEISPLVLYLRYYANSGDLVIIDEPEMNLHPEAQAKMIELLSMLVNADLNVLITTHSPYIVDHLINLMKAATYKNPKEIADKFYLKNPDAFISKDNVSVYLFGDGKARSILEEDGFIEWETFNQVSQRILDLRMEL